ncbi:MAG: tRNA (guanosine(37)-N1)-methyltransferase TrmD [Thermodesulfobacteriota bacterium]
MKFDILTLFPGFFDSPLGESVTGKAIERGLIEVRTHNIRDFATDKHKTTDDTPYGGGAGMVMKPGPVVSAIESLSEGAGAGGGEGAKGGKARAAIVILTTPQGVPFDNKRAKELSGAERLIIVCGRYEGVDERIREFADLEISIGDYVLTGGEIAALAIVDAVSRFVPGVLGDDTSAETDSFSEGLLEYPQYTRPEEFRGRKVPPVLLSGNHGEIEKWRRKEAVKRTAGVRPDLLDKAELTEEEREFIEELGAG